jgi:aspartyl/asparaginyl beta-hydroxylase (cupin superfamily)
LSGKVKVSLKDERADEFLRTWLPKIEQANRQFRYEAGSLAYAAFAVACTALASPRLMRKALRRRSATAEARPALQLPWLPYWPGLAARPVHDAASYPWVHVLRHACADIRAELMQVCDSFGRARYDSEFNAKPWQTYYFYLHGRPLADHLAACPRTREALAEVPHNGLHVCFSALEPQGALHPHTGPTNASITAHLGLLNCAGTRLWVGGEAVPYRDDDVLIFDDSFVHWVDNTGAKRRYTLMITLWHPELNALERQLLFRAIRVAAR